MAQRLQTVTLAAALAAGCAGAFVGCDAERSATRGGSGAVVRDQAARTLPVFRGDGTRVGFEDVVEAASEAEVVIIGENHGHETGLAWAAVLFDEVLARSIQSGGAALGMEFFERDEQTRLDDYLLGLTDEAAFRKRTARSDSNYPDGHRRMVEAAKAAGRPVIAANTTWEVVRYLRGKEYDALSSLTAEQRRLFRVPEAPASAAYRQRFDEVMSGQDEPKTDAERIERAERLDGAFRAQQLWDWTMADSVVGALNAGARPVVQVVGRFHADFDGGIVQAVEAIRPGTRVVVISVVDEHSPAGSGLREEDRGRADFVAYVGR